MTIRKNNPKRSDISNIHPVTTPHRYIVLQPNHGEMNKV